MESTCFFRVRKEHGGVIDRSWKGKSETGGEKGSSKGRGAVRNETLLYLLPRLSITAVK
jgi:hypothetical protein